MMKESLPRIYSSDEELFTPIDHETPDLLEDHRLEPYKGNKHVGALQKLRVLQNLHHPLSPHLVGKMRILTLLKRPGTIRQGSSRLRWSRLSQS